MSADAQSQSRNVSAQKLKVNDLESVLWDVFEMLEPNKTINRGVDKESCRLLEDAQGLTGQVEQKGTNRI